MTIPPAPRAAQPERPVRVEAGPDEIRIFARYSTDLREALLTLPRAHYVPGHWSVPAEHAGVALDLVREACGEPIIDSRQATR